MNIADIDIEQIVQQVLRQLEPAAAPAASVACTAPAKVTSTATLTERVITADLLAAHAQAGQQVQLTGNALVTPAARDYAREKQLTLIAAAPEAAGSVKTAGARWLLLTVDESSACQGAITAVKKQTSVRLQTERGDTAKDAAETSARELNRGGADGVVILCDKIATAACYANRHENIRAVPLAHAADLSLVDELDANVICVSHQGPSFADYLRIFRRLWTQGS